jgi:hypothetical protein
MSGDFFQGLRHLDEGWLAWLSSSWPSAPLVHRALLAHTTRPIGGIGPTLEIVPAGGHQSCRQRNRPFLVGEPPDMIRCQADLPEYLPIGLSVIDGREELLPTLDWQPCSRSCPFAATGLVTVGSATGGATATVIPPCCAAVRGLGSRPWILHVTGVLELPRRPRELSEHSLANPRRTRNGDTPVAEAACRTDPTSSASLTPRTLAGTRQPGWRRLRDSMAVLTTPGLMVDIIALLLAVGAPSSSKALLPGWHYSPARHCR